MRILIDEKMFDRLTSGQVVSFGGVELALQDIGYERMIAIIKEKLAALWNS